MRTDILRFDFLALALQLVAADFACRRLPNPLALSFSDDLGLEPAQREIAKTFKAANEEAKKAGIVSDYKILIGDTSTPQDFNILLMQQFPNMAALDGLRDKLDPIDKKVQGSLDAQRQGAVKRMEVRDIMGNKLMREITLK